MSTLQRLARLWRRLSLLLPPLLMVLLAGLSWWIAQEAGRGIGGRNRAAEPPQKPDYFLHDFDTRTFNARGQLVGDLSGQTMQHIPGSDTVHVTKPALRAQGAQGTITIAHAEKGISNSDGSNVQLLGNAVVHRTQPGVPEITVRSNFLNIFPNAERINSNLPSTVQRGASVFSGDSLDMNGLDGTFTMQGKVRGTVVRPAS